MFESPKGWLGTKRGRDGAYLAGAALHKLDKSVIRKAGGGRGKEGGTSGRSSHFGRGGAGAGQTDWVALLGWLERNRKAFGVLVLGKWSTRWVPGRKKEEDE